MNFNSENLKVFCVLFFLSYLFSKTCSVEENTFYTCCPDGFYTWQKSSCEYFPFNFSYSQNFEVYQNPYGSLSLKNAYFDYNESIAYFDSTIAAGLTAITLEKTKYLIEGGKLIIEKPNTWEQYEEQKVYCITFGFSPPFNTSDPPSPTLLGLYKIIKNKTEDHWMTGVELAGFITSSVFLIAVVVVYVILKQYKKLGDMLLLAFISNTILLYTALAVVRQNWNSLLEDAIADQFLLIIASLAHFLYLSNFFWMTVISYNLCKALFKKPDHARSLSTRGFNRMKWSFFKYFFYVYIVASLMTVATYKIDSLDLTHIRWFIKPNLTKEDNYMIAGPPKLLYLHTPVFILVIMNTLFFINIIIKVTKTKKSVAKHRDNELSGRGALSKRVVLYVKLFIVTGVSWIFEVFYMIFPRSSALEVLSDFNTFMGVVLFLMFVVKWKILFKLSEKLSVSTPWIQDRKLQHSQRHLKRNATRQTTVSQTND